MLKNDKCISVFVYKNRYRQLIDFISEHRLENVDYQLVMQENDPNLIDYAMYLEENGGCFKSLVCQSTNIFSKRKEWLDYMKTLDYDYVIECDDDLCPYGKYLVDKRVEPDNPHKKQKCDINKIYNRMFECLQEYDNCVMANPRQAIWLSLDGSLEDKPYPMNIIQLVSLNMKFIKEKDISYSGDPRYFEDVEFAINILRNGGNIYNINYLGYVNISIDKHRGLDTTVFVGDFGKERKFEELARLNMFLKYGGTLFWHGKRNVLMNRYRLGDWYNLKELPLQYGSKEKNNHIREICNGKEINLETLEEVKDYLKSLNNN